MRKLAQLGDGERSAMVQRVEAALTDKADRASMPAQDWPARVERPGVEQQSRWE